MANCSPPVRTLFSVKYSLLSVTLNARVNGFQKEAPMDLMEYVTEESILNLIRSRLDEKDELPEDFSLDRHVNGAKEVDHPSLGRISFHLADGMEDGFILQEGPNPEDSDDPLREALLLANQEKYAEAAKGARDFLCGKNFFSKDTPRRMIDYADELEAWMDGPDVILDGPRVYTLSFNLLRSETHVEMVKFALLLLSILNTGWREECAQIVRILSRCNEFTWFCGRAAENWPDRNERIFDMVRHVHGWGRINTLPLLKPETEEIRKWLLTEGWQTEFPNSEGILSVLQAFDTPENLFQKTTYDDSMFKGFTAMMNGLLHEEDDSCGMDRIALPLPLAEGYLTECGRHPKDLETYEVMAGLFSYLHVRTEGKVPDEMKQHFESLLVTPECRDTVLAAQKEGKGAALARFMGLEK